ncbi:MAG: hypothetical protein Q6361_05140, partial [Candidatus Hermodarchaeota archaeon]|nr:hypothetical protein [Candidatus Hermodarchaeota archaeon]
QLLYNWRTTIESVADVTTEVQIRRERAVRLNPNSTIVTRDYLAVGIQSNSTMYNALKYPTGYCTLGANETYVLTRSPHLSEFPVGSQVPFNIAYLTAAGRQDINLTLTVVNQVTISDNLLPKLVAGRVFWSGGEFPFWLYQNTDFFLVDLDKTFLPILDFVALHPDAYNINLDPSIHINVDRFSLINPYNLVCSASAITQIELQLRNALGDVGWLYNYLSSQLVGLDGTVTVQRLTYLYLIIPVCFLAAYLSLTINEVTYDQRRREIGLLLTRGFSEPQIMGIFSLEVTFTALCSSALGVGLAVLLVSNLTGGLATALFVIAAVGLDTIMLTILVGVALATISTLLPARKALIIQVSEALRDYAPRSPWSIGEKHWFVWVSFILGSYHLVLLFFGINLEYLVTQVWSISILLSSLLLLLAGINALLMWVGPFLFFYGFTAIVVKHSRRFYQVLERIVNRLATNLGSVAAHTVQRNPRRISAVVFLAALLVGYGVHVMGNSAIYNDVLTRSIYLQVGADLRVEVAPTVNQTELLAAIESIEGIKAATVQTTFIINFGETEAEIRVINANEWRTIAYYEPEWFPLIPAEQALDALNATPEGIILEHQLAVERGLSLNDTFTIDTLG